jgi:hypothetical protein
LNNLTIVVRIVVSFLLVSSFFLQTQKAYEKDAMDKDMVLELKDSYEDTEEEEEAMEEGEE